MRPRLYSLLLLVPVLLLYGSACGLPAVQVDEGGRACTALRLGTLPGWMTLLVGWVPPLTLPWSANLLLPVGVILLLCRRVKLAAGFGAAAAALGLTVWTMSHEWQALRAGYYCWQASLITFAIGSGLLAWRLAGPAPTRQGEDAREGGLPVVRSPS